MYPVTFYVNPDAPRESWNRERDASRSQVSRDIIARVRRSRSFTVPELVHRMKLNRHTIHNCLIRLRNAGLVSPGVPDP